MFFLRDFDLHRDVERLYEVTFLDSLDTRRRLSSISSFNGFRRENLKDPFSAEPTNVLFGDHIQNVFKELNHGVIL